jgi:Type VI secretion system/phage-baseplate injector OB domain
VSDPTDAKKRFYGKYRGTVLINVDPMNLGRITATVPAVFGVVPSGWALPSLPLAGIMLGFYAVPPIGAWVWIEFEGGDPEHPIWSGCFWGDGQLPLPAKVPAPPPGVKVVLQTQTGHNVVLDDTPGAGGILITAAPGTPGAPMVSVTPLGIMLQTPACTVSLTSAGVTITAPTVTINGSPVQINGTALVVV